MPRKPTNPFGTIIFSKDGRVAPDIRSLSDDKSSQETEVIAVFVKQLLVLGVELPDAVRLPEDDFDFLFPTEERTFVELTELVDRAFATPLELGGYSIDREAEALALATSVRRKLGKHYRKVEKGKLWLVIFSTFPYATEYFQGGQRMHSAGLVAARELLAHDSGPFDQVWFTDLITNPVRVWPT